MAATVIDSLVVTLGLNSLNFKKGQQDISRAVKDTERTVKSSAEEMSSALSGVALKFTGLLLGIRGIEDIVHIFRNLSGELWQLGINSKNLGIAANELRDWQEVAELAGGKAEDATAAVNGLQRAIFNLKFRGQSGDQIEGLLRLGINPIRYGEKKEDFDALMLQIAGQLEKRFGDQATRYQYATNYLGLTGGIATAVSGGTAKLREFLATAAKAPQITKKQTDEQGKLNEEIVAVRYNLAGVSAEILTNLTPALEGLTDVVNRLATPLRWIADLFGNDSDPKSIWNQKGFGTGYTINGPGTTLGKAQTAVDSWWRNLWSTAKERRARAGYAEDFSAIEKDMGLPAGLLDRVATAESHYDATQVSAKGAVGTFQLMPKDFPGAGQDTRIDAENAAAYLRQLHDQFGSWDAAVAAYNEGPGAYSRGKMPTETRRYVNRVLGSPVNPATSGGASAAASRPQINLPSWPTSSTAAPASRVQIDSITVNTQATDASRMAADMSRAVQRKFNVAYADTGLV